MGYRPEKCRACKLKHPSVAIVGRPFKAKGELYVDPWPSLKGVG
jgi:hypothetical protein